VIPPIRGRSAPFARTLTDWFLWGYALSDLCPSVVCPYISRRPAARLFSSLLACRFRAGLSPYPSPGSTWQRTSFRPLLTAGMYSRVYANLTWLDVSLERPEVLVSRYVVPSPHFSSSGSFSPSFNPAARHNASYLFSLQPHLGPLSPVSPLSTFVLLLTLRRVTSSSLVPFASPDVAVFRVPPAYFYRFVGHPGSTSPRICLTCFS